MQTRLTLPRSTVYTPCRVRSRRLVTTMVANKDQLTAAKADLTALIKEKQCNPIMIRLAWHDSGSYNKDVADWPARGGANGSIRFDPELGYGCNAGLNGATAMLEPIKAKYPDVTYADLYQMASALAIELAGGPKIPMRYGRVDAPGPADDGLLPGAAPPFGDGSVTPAEHLRKVFYRMGLDDKEIVALSGAHTLGRAYKNRSGFGAESTKYTKDGPGTKGGSSWTPEWLKFDNSYFVEVKEKKDAELLVLPTDDCLFTDPGFKPHAEKYAADQDSFFSDYAAAHARLSELGSKWDGEPVAV